MRLLGRRGADPLRYGGQIQRHRRAVDPSLRDGIKAFADWPTIPQLYVKGEFVGGCDIVREMAANGELVPLLKEKGVLA